MEILILHFPFARYLLQKEWQAFSNPFKAFSPPVHKNCIVFYLVDLLG